jgi:hypothetical protein
MLWEGDLSRIKGQVGILFPVSNGFLGYDGCEWICYAIVYYVRRPFMASVFVLLNFKSNTIICSGGGLQNDMQETGIARPATSGFVGLADDAGGAGLRWWVLG